MSSTPGSSSGPAAAGSSSQRSRRPRCPQCGSRRFRKEASTGLVFCALGHVLQGFREEETQEGEDIGSQASQRTRRRLRREGAGAGLPGRRRRSQAARDLLERRQARERFLQCLQLLLRLQIKAIRRELPGIPEGFEGVCRDLWAMYVSMQPEEGLLDSDDPGHHQDASLSPASTNRALDPSATEEDRESESRDEEMRKLGLEMSDYGDETPSASAQTSDADVDSSHEYAPGSPLISQRASATTSRIVRSRIARGRHELSTLLSVIYLGLVSIRIPVQWSDMIQLIAACRLPYLHAIHELPHDMVQKLPKVEIVLLDQTRVPDATKLYHHTLQVAADLNDKFDVFFPPLNALPLIWRCIERLSLPPPFYVAVKRLLDYVRVPTTAVTDRYTSAQDAMSSTFTGSIGGTPSAVQLAPTLVVSMNRQSVPREVVIMAATVVVAKMHFGLDGSKRREDKNDQESLVGFMPCEVWLKQLAFSKQRYLSDPLAVFSPAEREVMNLNEGQLDEYLDFAERLLVHPVHPRIHTWRTRPNVSDVLSCCGDDVQRRFPLPRAAGNPLEAQLATFIPSGQPIIDKQARAVEDIAAELQETIQDMPTSKQNTDSEHVHGDQYTIHHPSQEHADHLSNATLLKRPPKGLRGRGRPRKPAFESQSADVTQEMSAIDTHPQLRMVLDFASRLVGIDVDTLATTVYHLETQLVKIVAHQDNVRRIGERREKAVRQGKRPPGRPPKYNLDNVLWSKDASLTPMRTSSPLSTSHVPMQASSPPPTSSPAQALSSEPRARASPTHTQSLIPATTSSPALFLGTDNEMPLPQDHPQENDETVK